MSFKTINLEEYRKLLKNKKKMFDMTFPTPESVNKYRDNDENINQNILREEEINKQNKNLSEMFDKNLNKYFNEKNVPITNNIDINDSTDITEVDKNKLKDVFEIEDQYKFITDEDILNSFKKAFNDYNIVYKPYKSNKK